MEDDREILLQSDDDIELRDPIRRSDGIANYNNNFNGDVLPNQNDSSITNNNRTREQEPRSPSNIVYVSAGVAAIGGLLFGYDMGIISGAKSQMQHDLLLSCGQVESVVAFLPVGGFFASLVGGFVVDKYGRKMTIILNAFFFTLGALIITFSWSMFFILVGRFILGFAVSLSAIAECIYISEISTPEKRGMLVSLNELGITVGILVSFLVNYIFADTPQGWRYMFGLSSFVAVAQGIGMIFLPQTPQFLMISKKDAKAEATLRQLGITTNVRQTMTNIRISLQEESSSSFLSLLCQNAENIGSRLFIGIGIVFFQQFTGQPNIIYYAADIFKQVGFCSQWSSTLASVGLGLMKVMSTVISLCIVDRVGRRKALISGISAMLFSVLVLSVYAFYSERAAGSMGLKETCTEIIPGVSLNESFIEENDLNCAAGSEMLPKGWRFMAFFALVGFVCAYSFSFGPVSWIVLSEIFPASTKGRAMAMATAFNWLGNSIVTATFLSVSAAITLGGVFLSYAILCIFAILFVSLFLPETKNKSLEQISKELKSKSTRSIMRENLCCTRSSKRETYEEYSPVPIRT